MRQAKKNTGKSERGSALVYILIAIALLAALTVSFMNPSSNQTTSQNTFKSVSEIQSQVDFVRSAIQECILLHQTGDGKAIADGAQLNQPYPLMPDDAYFANCVADPADTDNFVSLLRCPGNNPGPAGAVTEGCHGNIFGGNTGKFMPPQPSLFGPWRYYSGDDGVFFWIETTATDAFIDTVLDKLDSEFSKCEGDKIVASGADVEMTSDMPGDVVCPDGSKCFRVWMKTDAASAVYQEAGCP
ncbi:MAG: hypothetical protein CO093_00590 [Alphaproteobacteria bacterium CG_4_9_14_3_um_filter_47_13]|nr:MAG: hypothetical protein CO093_00590 [Alphaproteobacteria bacterium CG_4_9_14_3_um_filter_47_13]